jgi:hypothetical protein
MEIEIILFTFHEIFSYPMNSDALYSSTNDAFLYFTSEYIVMKPNTYLQSNERANSLGQKSQWNLLIQYVMEYLSNLSTQTLPETFLTPSYLPFTCIAQQSIVSLLGSTEMIIALAASFT